MSVRTLMENSQLSDNVVFKDYHSKGVITMDANGNYHLREQVITSHQFMRCAFVGLEINGAKTAVIVNTNYRI